MAAATSGAAVDPRVRRTRRLLQDALQMLLERKSFDQISVQDIADAATVNRVTFYDHYPDKHALLECVVESRFAQLIKDRRVKFDCSSALRSIALAVCDYLGGAGRMDSNRQREMEPHLESAIIAVIRRMILEGIRKHPSPASAPPETIATTVSWAIYGAAQEWARKPNRSSSAKIAGTISSLVAPILDGTRANPSARQPRRLT